MFVVYKCEGEKYFKSSTQEGIICPVDGDFCPYCGYCVEWKKVRHTQSAMNCTKKEWAKKQKESAENTDE